MQPKIVTLALLGVSLASCTDIPAVNSAKVPPFLIKENKVYGCNKITTVEKLVRCYILHQKELEISNEDNKSIKKLSTQWENRNESGFFAWS